MLGIHDFAWFLLAGLLLNITPGADMLFILTRTTARGARAGAVAALGVGAGCLVHVTAAAAGLSALVAASHTAFAVVKWMGAAYLVWLGLTLVRRGLVRRAAPDQGVGLDDSAGAPVLSAVMLQGMLTNLLNPKIILFFLAFLPQFVRPATGSQGWAFLLLGVVFTLNSTLFNLLVAVLAARAHARLGRVAAMGRWVRGATGLVFVGLGLRLALATRA
ncbi:MAG: LysE family translocator [Proteobacteria bacterium]|nr:LysE family translocator [Pseudomonadota bacterium]